MAAFRKARAADPDDRHGASLHLMRLGAEEIAAMPSAYVQTLFDQYAPRFESALVGDLGYRGPALLFKAVLSARGARQEAGLSSSARSISAAAPGLRPRPLPAMSIASSASTCRRA